MSFGYSIGDGILLAQLAWKTLQGARKSCGEYDELTREVASLHRVLQRLQKELANPDSLINRVDDDRRQELNDHGEGCETVLNVMNSIVTKYNKLSNTERSGKRIWQKIKFGNGEMKDLADIRLKLSAHTSAITMSLNLCSLGSQGRVEQQLSDMGGDLHGIRGKVNWIAANMTARSGDGTVWTSYENDDKSFWRQLRRELVREGYRSSVLHKHKGLLKDYVEELGRRGAFDQVDSEKSEDEDEDEDSQGSMEPEDDCSAVTGSEGSKPEDSDLDPLVLNDSSDQLEDITGPDPALEPETPPDEPSPPHPTLVQLLDMSGQDPSVSPISQIEPSVGVSSSADEFPSKPYSPEDEVLTSPMSPHARASTTQIRVPLLPRPSLSQDGETEEATSDSDWLTEAVRNFKFNQPVPRKRTLPKASTSQVGGQSRGQDGDWRPQYVYRIWRPPDLPRPAIFQAAGFPPLSRADTSQVAGPPPLPRASTFQTGEIGGWGVRKVIETASSTREAKKVLEWQEHVARSVNGASEKEEEWGFRLVDSFDRPRTVPSCVWY